MNEFLMITKNRGWRGLAEVKYLNEDKKVIQKMVFSFSQDVWTDMIFKNKIVLQDEDNYIVITFTSDELPRKDQQRSVLINYALAKIVNKTVYSKSDWRTNVRTPEDFRVIDNFIKNQNNHTTSNWNCIGIRVKPEI